MARKTLGFVNLEWICPNCKIRNPGPQKSCAGCGAAQPEDIKFVQARREVLLADETVIQKVKTGVDIHCPFCKARNVAGATQCSQCGGDLTEGTKRVSGRVVGAFRDVPQQELICPACGASNPNSAHRCAQCGSSLEQKEVTEPALPQPPEKKNFGIFKIIAIATAMLLCFGLAVWAMVGFSQRDTLTGSVQEVEWVHTIAIEEFGVDTREAWADEIPTDAEIENCVWKLRRVQDEPHPDAEEVCGEAYTEDTGTGYGEVIQDCEYHVYADFCTYTVYDWRHVDDFTLQGADNYPLWRDPTLSPEQRVGERTASYKVVFETNNKTYTYTTTDADLYQRCLPGSQWLLTVNAFGGIVSIEPQ